MQFAINFIEEMNRNTKIVNGQNVNETRAKDTKHNINHVIDRSIFWRFIKTSIPTFLHDFQTTLASCDTNNKLKYLIQYFVSLLDFSPSFK